MKRLLLVAALLLLSATPAHAENAQQVAEALRSSPVYQSAGVDLVDVATLTNELANTDPQVYVAVLPASAADSGSAARERAVEIGRALGRSDDVVLVITANGRFGTGEGSEAAARGVRSGKALQEELKALHGHDKDALTAFVTSFAERITNQASRPVAGAPPVDTGGGSHGSGLLGVLVLLGGGAAVAAVVSSRRRKARLNEGLRAEVEQLYERLGADVLQLDAGDDKVAKQALADAAERYSACGGQLASADSPAEFAAARRTAIEGLTAARTARTALGLDPGPEPPAVPGDGPQLGAPGQVTVGGQTYEGSPQYAPGRPYYYGGGYVGGQQVLGGWYSGNFWEPFLLGSILTGGFGGGLGGGGFERGYDQGYEAGRDAGGGGDWGGSSGGGDWGGSSGGGDWGGGGDGGGGGDW
jgi:uncharacterized membrane protein YgcG